MKAYTTFARFYDSIMEGINYQDWASYLERLFQLHNSPGKEVLDLACGTGSLTCILAKRGYQALGLDLSPVMIEKAREKARGLKNISFTEGDMRSFSLEKKFDLIICLYDSLNYMLEEEDLSLVFSSCYQSLYQGGLFIFDVNTRDRFRRVKPGTCLYEGDGFYCFWKDNLYLEPLLWQVDLTFFVRQEDGTYVKEEETHLERAYSRDLLSSLLQKAGFQVLAIYRDYTLQKVEEYETASRYFFVARKDERR